VQDADVRAIGAGIAASRDDVRAIDASLLSISRLPIRPRYAFALYHTCKNLRPPHTSYLIPHTSYLIPHTSYPIPHTSYLIPQILKFLNPEM